MSLDFRAVDFFVQLPPITMLLQMFDGSCKPHPIAPCRSGRAIGRVRPSPLGSGQTRCSRSGARHGSWTDHGAETDSGAALTSLQVESEIRARPSSGSYVARA